MKTDIYGQFIFTEDDICELYMIDPKRKITKIFSDKKIDFSETLELQNVPEVSTYLSLDLSIEKFDQEMQNNWLIPDEYKNMDIAKYILDMCKNDQELQRAGHELILFQEREMFDLLKYLKYLVDTMRKNNIVWGVGRGSSVASFVLFLLGIHKINSLYYDLSIDEFLK